jgi:dTDP-4-dehydrorhamnose 3,5-epimerase
MTLSRTSTSAGLHCVDITPLPIKGSWVISLDVHADHRGLFLEVMTRKLLRSILRRPVDLSQVSVSSSRVGVIRGIHTTIRPPGQSKTVMCVHGSIRDVIVDLRPESPSFGRWHSVELSDQRKQLVLLSEGLGHGFEVVSDSATVLYGMSTEFDSSKETAVNPFDPDLALPWSHQNRALTSFRDSSAPTLGQLLASDPCPLRQQSPAQ